MLEAPLFPSIVCITDWLAVFECALQREHEHESDSKLRMHITRLHIICTHLTVSFTWRFVLCRAVLLPLTKHVGNKNSDFNIGRDFVFSMQKDNVRSAGVCILAHPTQGRREYMNLCSLRSFFSRTWPFPSCTCTASTCVYRFSLCLVPNPFRHRMQECVEPMKRRPFERTTVEMNVEQKWRLQMNAQNGNSNSQLACQGSGSSSNSSELNIC